MASRDVDIVVPVHDGEAALAGSVGRRPPVPLARVPLRRLAAELPRVGQRRRETRGRGPLPRFLGVGVASTLAYALLYVLLRGALGGEGANALALAVTAVANTAANRRLTFGVRGRAGLLGQHLRGALVYVLTVALTSGALEALHAADPHPSRALELAVLVAASLATTVARYVALRAWVFAEIPSAPSKVRRMIADANGRT